MSCTPTSAGKPGVFGSRGEGVEGFPKAWMEWCAVCRGGSEIVVVLKYHTWALKSKDLVELECSWGI